MNPLQDEDWMHRQVMVPVREMVRGMVRGMVREKVMAPEMMDGNTKDHYMGLGSLDPNSSLMTRKLIDQPQSSRSLTWNQHCHHRCTHQQTQMPIRPTLPRLHHA